MHKKPNNSVFGRVGAAIRGWNMRRKPVHFPPVIFGVTGLALLTAAAWTVALPLGLVAAGLSCFILEWRVGEK